MSRRVPVALALVLAAIVVALHHAFHLHAAALWRDEVNSVNVASLPSLWSTVANAHLDSFPMAWVAVLHAWLAAGFGDTDAEVRRLGFAIGLALVAVLWWSARRLGVRAPLVSLLLVGMNPTAIVYGSQVRGYGLGTLAMAWCTGALWSYVETPTRRRGVVALAATIVAAQTYFGNCFLVAAVCIAAALADGRPGARRRAIAVLAIGAAAALSMVANLPSVLYAARLSPIEKSTYGIGWYANIFWGSLGPGVPALRAAWVVAAVAAAVGIAWAWRLPASPAAGLPAGDAARARYVGLAVALGTIAYYAFAKYIGVQTNYWYYLPLLALLALAAEVGVALLVARVPRGGLVRALAVAVGALLCVRDAAATVRMRMTNLDVVATTVAGTARPNDFVVVAPWYTGITFARYYRGPAPWATLPDLADHRFHLHAELIERMKDGDAGIAPVLARVEATLRAGGRVWIVGPLLAPPPGEPPPHLPPWPNGPEGPLNAPYVEGWARQLGAMLREHGADVFQVHLPALGAVNRWEDQPLEYVEGWR